MIAPLIGNQNTANKKPFIVNASQLLSLSELSLITNFILNYKNLYCHCAALQATQFL